MSELGNLFADLDEDMSSYKPKLPKKQDDYLTSQAKFQMSGQGRVQGFSGRQSQSQKSQSCEERANAKRKPWLFSRRTP
jgi:hypothetical protein